jgi:hypothetical protein
MSHIDSYFFRKEVTSLPLKVREVSSEPGRGKGCMTIGVPEVAMGGINIDFKRVLGPRVLPFKRLLDMCY